MKLRPSECVVAIVAPGGSRRCVVWAGTQKKYRCVAGLVLLIVLGAAAGAGPAQESIPPRVVQARRFLAQRGSQPGQRPAPRFQSRRNLLQARPQASPAATT